MTTARQNESRQWTDSLIAKMCRVSRDFVGDVSLSLDDSGRLTKL